MANRLRQTGGGLRRPLGRRVAAPRVPLGVLKSSRLPKTARRPNINMGLTAADRPAALSLSLTRPTRACRPRRLDRVTPPCCSYLF